MPTLPILPLTGLDIDSIWGYMLSVTGTFGPLVAYSIAFIVGFMIIDSVAEMFRYIGGITMQTPYGRVGLTRGQLRGMHQAELERFARSRVRLGVSSDDDDDYGGWTVSTPNAGLLGDGDDDDDD